MEGRKDGKAMEKEGRKEGRITNEGRKEGTFVEEKGRREVRTDGQTDGRKEEREEGYEDVRKEGRLRRREGRKVTKGERGPLWRRRMRMEWRLLLLRPVFSSYGSVSSRGGPVKEGREEGRREGRR